MLPPLSQAMAKGESERFRHLVDQALRLLVYVVVPLTGSMLVLAGPGISLLYQHGRFSVTDTATMTPVFAVFLVGLVAHVLIALLAPVFYAGKDTRTPVTAALLAVGVDVAAAVALFPSLHLAGLALAIGLGAWFEVSLLLIMIQRRVGFDLRPLARSVATCLPGAVLATAATLVADRAIVSLTRGSGGIPVLVVELALASLTGLAVYLVWSMLLRVPELGAARELVRTLLRRRA
jgi:putative peptidoglycan lipid II flippase